MTISLRKTLNGLFIYYKKLNTYYNVKNINMKLKNFLA